MTLVGIRINQTSSTAEGRLAGCVLSGASQLPLLIAPCTYPGMTTLSSSSSLYSKDFLDTPVDCGNSVDTKSERHICSSDESDWCLHIQSCYASPRLQLLKGLLSAKNPIIPQVSELSIIFNQSRIDLRYEEIPLFMDLVRDFQIATESLWIIRAISPSVPELQQASETIYAPGLQALNSFKASNFLEELQPHLEQLSRYPNLNQLSDATVSVVEPLIRAAQTDPFAYRRAIHSCLEGSNLLADLNPTVVDGLRELAGPDTIPSTTTSSQILRLIRISVSLPNVYWIAPSVKTPMLEDLQEEPNALMVLRLGNSL